MFVVTIWSCSEKIIKDAHFVNFFNFPFLKLWTSNVKLILAGGGFHIIAEYPLGATFLGKTEPPQRRAQTNIFPLLSFVAASSGQD